MVPFDHEPAGPRDLGHREEIETIVHKVAAFLIGRSLLRHAKSDVTRPSE
jgi:hypothetical protein